MLEVKFVDDTFLVKGSFSLGIAGKYVNEDFGEESIQILDSYEEIVDSYNDDGFFWGILKEYLGEDELTGENLARAIGDYYNNLEKKAQTCIRQINSNLLINVFYDMIGCGLAFWNIEGAYVKDKMPDCQEDAYGEVIYEPNWDAVDALYEEYRDTPNDGSIEKTDVELRLRELFPMFNMDGLIEGIQPEGLTLKGRYVSFQCSDSWKRRIMCCAYDNMDEHFTFTDWHNF